VFSAIVISRIIYAIESWGNFVSKDLEGKIDKMFKKAKRWGLTTKLYTFVELKQKFSDNLFHQVCSNSNHCLFHLMPALRDRTYNLRDRSHDHQHIGARKNFHRKSFIVSCLVDGGKAK
jgi:hypothetical protein